MKIYVVDFEEVLKNFSPYHISLEKINSEKEKFSNKIEDIKKEMETIIGSSKSLFLDENTQMKNANRFKELQTDAVKLESEFRNDVVELQNKELESNFKQVSEIVSEWAKTGHIDIVLNKSQAIFVSDQFEVTSNIIDLLKEKSLYKEFNTDLVEM